MATGKMLFNHVKGEIMNRRTFLKTAAIGTIATGFGATLVSADQYFPTKVDQSLYSNINRVKDKANKTPLEKSHAPIISVPASVKVGEPFTVEVVIGEKLHGMSPSHWIENIELAIGNEPAGRIDMQPKGYLQPKVIFTVVLPKEAAPSGKVTLVAYQRCNLHGYWESSVDVSVS